MSIGTASLPVKDILESVEDGLFVSTHFVDAGAPRLDSKPEPGSIFNLKLA